MRTLAAALSIAFATGAPAHDRDHGVGQVGETRSFPLETLQVPDAAVIDQDGRERRFRTEVMGDGPVIVTFTYTSCRTVCPVANGVMAMTGALLDERGDAATRLVSVSVDPLNDTPAKLREAGAILGADARWTMVTGTVPEIAGLLRSLGLRLGAVEDHDPMFLVGDGGTQRFTRFAGIPDPEALAAALPAPR